MYKEELTNLCFKSLFGSLDILEYSFDIEIESVMILRYDEDAIGNKGFAVKIADDVSQRLQYAIIMGS